MRDSEFTCHRHSGTKTHFAWGRSQAFPDRPQDGVDVTDGAGGEQLLVRLLTTGYFKAGI